MGNPFQALRGPSFRWFCITAFISNIGVAIQIVAEGWLVFHLTGSAGWLGAVAAGAALPFLVFTPPGGVYADRWQRRRALAILQTIMASSAAAIAILIQYDCVRPWHILIAAIVTGSATALGLPSSGAMVKDLVPPEDLASGVSLLIGQFQLSKAIGPFFASWFLARSSNAACFYANAASFLPFIFVLGFIVPSPPPPARDVVRPSIFESLRSGLEVAYRDRSIRTLLMFAALVGGCLSPMLTLLPQLADVYTLDASHLGYLYATTGAAATAGAFTATIFMGRYSWQRLLFGAMALGAAGLAGIGLVDQIYSIAGFVAICSYILAMTWVAITTTLQRITPDVYRGRILSLNFLAFTLSAGLGNLVVGPLAGHLGPRHALLAVAVVLAGCLALRARPSMTA